MSPEARPDLKPLLDKALRECRPEQRLQQDPVGLVHPYDRASDREVAALFASCLAYGRVDVLRGAIRRALEPLGAHPARRLKQISERELSRLWPDFVYRMTRGEDLRDLAAALRTTLRNEGNLEHLYRTGHPGDPPLEDTDAHLECASRFVERLRRRRLRDELHRGFRYLLVDPADGSACKRLQLFFRWVVRGPDTVDLGLWDAVDSAALVMPLDTHILRLSRYLGLLERKTADLKAALQVTRRLAELDPGDPLRYDFALCHLGISERCIHRRCPQRCPACPIEPACVLPESPG